VRTVLSLLEWSLKLSRLGLLSRGRKGITNV
jgi:hypothetical protein